MIYIKWFALLILDLFMLIFTALPAAIIIPLFTRAQEWERKDTYTWGWIWGTHDNPPQGDKGYHTKRAPFTNELTGLKGYINRVFWMLRNPLYGLARRMSLPYSADYVITHTGNLNISDKYKIPGHYFMKVFDKQGGKLVGFEYYLIKPWAGANPTKDLRVRLGWKIATDKFAERGYAQFVGTFNPFDGYGDN